MLALKTFKISPMFSNGTLMGRDFSVAASSIYFAPLMGSNAFLPATNYNIENKVNTSGVLARNNFIIRPTIVPFVLTTIRFNSSEHHPTSSKPTGWPEKPAGWPDKEQLERYEKYFFRTIAFIIDITRWSLEWAIRNFEQHIGKHPTVQHYWKKFIEKLENSRK